MSRKIQIVKPLVPNYSQIENQNPMTGLAPAVRLRLKKKRAHSAFRRERKPLFSSKKFWTSLEILSLVMMASGLAVMIVKTGVETYISL